MIDVDRLNWLNRGHTLRKLQIPIERQKLIEELRNKLLQEYVAPSQINDAYLSAVLELVAEKVHRICEIPAFTPYFFRKLNEAELKHALELALEFLDVNELKPFIDHLQDQVSKLPDSPSVSDCVTVLESLKASNASKLDSKRIIPLARSIITGKSVGASLAETMALLGKANTIALIADFQANLKQ